MKRYVDTIIIHCSRPVERIGAHCKGHNEGSIGICYEGGLDAKGVPTDTRTAEQKKAMKWLVETLKKEFPIKVIDGGGFRQTEIRTEVI